jgi:hypothetical protein
MKTTTQNFASLLLGSIGSFVLATVSTPAQSATIFNFSTTEVVDYNSSALPLTSTIDGITGSANTPVGTNQPASSLFNTTNANGGTVNSTLTGLTASFDKSVFLKSFEITQWQNLTSGTINFQAGSSSQLFNLTGISTQTFSTGFKVDANTPILITTTGVIPDSNSGAFRITAFTVEDVPGPLPILAVGAAYGWSRKLKNKSGTSAKRVY